MLFVCLFVCFMLIVSVNSYGHVGKKMVSRVEALPGGTNSASVSLGSNGRGPII